MSARFFAPDAHAPGDLISLPEYEAQHLTRVLRLGAGDSVHIFNGRGDEFASIVETTTGKDVRVRVGEPHEPRPEARLQVTIAQAVLKGDKMDDVVRDAVMMGAAAIQPVVTVRTEVSLAALAKAHRRERWERVAVSSAKQCGRAVVPPVLAPVSLRGLTQTLLSSWLAGPSLLLVEPGASEDAIPFGEFDVDTPDAATVVIGPEGGWTADEIEEASVVCRPVTMGQRTLRADAMALVAMSAIFARWGEF